MRRTLLLVTVTLSLLVLSSRVLALTINANVSVTNDFSTTGSISKGSGTFVIDHPLDPKNKLLYHSFVESPDVKNIYVGNIMLDERGEATVELPAYFEALNVEFRYQLFPLGEAMPGLYIKKRIEHNRFTIGGGAAGGEVSWQVTGIRHDPYILAHPIVPEVEKGPNALIGKGQYIFPAGYSGTFSDSYLSFFRRLVYLLGQL